jgi:PKHD-type hydroxylase
LLIYVAELSLIGDTKTMMITIADVLDSAEIQAACEILEDAPFADGGSTAGGGARAVKSNLQGRSDASSIKAVTEKARRALEANSVFAAAALPVRFARTLVSRYEPGMSYGWHTDQAFIDNVRTDLSFTLFLSDLASYDGGALELTNSTGEDLIRLPPVTLFCTRAEICIG